MTVTAEPSGAWGFANLVTIGRILAVPAVAGLLAVADPAGPAWAWWWAFAVFALASVSDYLDGYLARLLNEQSELGRMLDPIADKLLVGVVLLMLAAKQVIAGWSLLPALAILSREILVSGLREHLAGLQVKVLVTRLAKWKTTLQLIALGALLLGPAVGPGQPGLAEAGIALLWLSAALTAYTGHAYLSAALGHAAGARGEP